MPSVPRYIPFPDTLYQLRRQYPSVLERVLLECTRCRQWCAVKALPVIPDVEPTGQPVAQAAADAMSIHLRNAQQEKARRRYEKAQAGGEWHSPRRRTSAEPLPSSVSRADTESEERLRAAILEQVVAAHEKRRKAAPPPPTLYIPNPCVYTCDSRNCQLGDLLVDLRQEWLGALNQDIRTDGDRSRKATGSDDQPGVPTADVLSLLQHRREALNEALAKELDLRRSGRLAGRRPPVVLQHGSSPEESDDGVGSSGNPSLSHDDLTNPNRTYGLMAWLQAAAAHLSHDDEATLTAFCWVTCELCGKLRRVAQPFPGGAPYICALSCSTIGSCEVSEMEGIENYTSGFAAEELRRAALACPLLPFPLRQEAATLLLGQPTSAISADSTAATRLMEDPLLRLLRTDAASFLIHRGGRRLPSANTLSPRNGCISPVTVSPHTSALATNALPLLKQLVAFSRKRLLGAALVRHVMLTPQEIQRKREAVLEKAFLSGEDLASEVATNAQPLPLLAGGAAKRTADNGHGAAPSSTVAHHSALTSRALAAQGSLQRHEVTHPSPYRSGSRKRSRSPEVPVQKQPALSAQPPIAQTKVVMPVTVEVVGSAPPPGKRKRGRPPTSRTAATVAAGVPVAKVRREPKEELARDVVHWVQCDRCGKWRIVPTRIPADVPFWECGMRVDGTTACEDPEDVENT